MKEEDLEAIFSFQDKKIQIQFKRDEKMKQVFDKFYMEENISEKNKNLYHFMYDSKEISDSSTFPEIINENESQTKIIINVLVEEEKIFNEYTIFEDDNKNNNYPNNIQEKQMNNYSNLNDNNLSLSFKNRDNILKDINKTLKEPHFCITHSTEKEKERYTSYCKDCQKDLCIFCEKEHQKHNKERYVPLTKEELYQILKDLEQIENKVEEFIQKLYSINDYIKLHNKKIKEIVDNYNPHNRNYQTMQIINKIFNDKTIFDDINNPNIEQAIYISSSIISKYIFQEVEYNNNIKSDTSEFNCQFSYHKEADIQKNINIQDNIISNINIKEEGENSKYLNENIVQNEFGKISEYNNINPQNFNDNQAFNKIQNKNIIKLKYKINKKEKEKIRIKIFGKKFINNNINNDNNFNNKCYFIYNNKKYYLSEYLEIDNIKKIECVNIRLIGINEIINPSHMFDDCSSLISIKGFNKYKTHNVTDMSFMFNNCSLLETITSISKWDTINVEDMSYMFNGCKSLKELPDISKWNVKNVTNMSNMFCNCLSLKQFPDISTWNVENLEYASSFFSGCKYLENLPDISKWNVENIENLSSFLSGCESLKQLPDISKWKLSNCKDLSNFFKNCCLLENLPDISKWDISNVYKINSLFQGCRKLKELHNISKWNTQNLTDINKLFLDCISLEVLDDISKWKTENIKNMRELFKGCHNLLKIPNISKWNYKKVRDISFLFEGCINLDDINNFSEWNIENERINGEFKKPPDSMAGLFVEN